MFQPKRANSPRLSSGPGDKLLCTAITMMVKKSAKEKVNKRLRSKMKFGARNQHLIVNISSYDSQPHGGVVYLI